MICVQCQTPNPETSRFCSQCGEVMTLVPSSEDSATIAPGTGAPVPGRKPFNASDSMGSTTAGTFAGSAPGMLMGILPKGFKLANRYEIEEPLGMGGMGMVYRARDVDLGVPVALKLIRGEYASNEQVITRFKQEINIARRVTHRNVARIYDLGESEGLRYLTMEYIEGQDFSHIVEKGGPVSVERGISVLRQVCSALKEAHASGVVHRDLKPHNIMLDPQGSVHLMDFGIAMSADVQGFTRTGALIGTPDYMSPEQAEGKKVDHRTDIYSLGVTMYEILTGDAPFRGGTPWEVIRKQIEERAHSIRRTRPEVPEWLDTLVLKCLEKDPALRYQSVGEILLDLDRQEAHLSARHYLPSRRALGLGGAALALVLAAAGITFYLKPRGPVAGGGARVSVAILPFENQSGRAELDWLRTGLADNLTTDLGESKYFRVLSRERLTQIYHELGLGEEAKMTSAMLKRIAEYGAVEAVVTGSFLSQGDQIRVNLRTQDPQTGENLKTKAVNGHEKEVLAMIDDLTRATKEMFELAPERAKADADLTIASARTSSVESASLYQKGVDLIYAGKNLEAIEPLQEAIRADADYAMAHARLAEAHMRTGHDREATEAIQKAMDRLLAGTEKLPQADRTFIRALDGRIMHRPEDSVRAYAEILKTDPDDPAAGFALGEVLEETGDYPGAEQRFIEALKHDAKNPSLQFALGRVRIKAGDSQAALPDLQKALELYTQMGSEEGQGLILNAIGRANDTLGRFDEALDYYSRSEAIKRRIGDKRGLASTLNNKAGILQIKGRIDESTKITEEALALSREIGTTAMTAALLTSLGSLREDGGDPESMSKYYSEALELRRLEKNRAEQATCLLGLSRSQSALGRLTQAEETLAEGERIAQEIADEDHLAEILSEKGYIDTLRGDLKAAQEKEERAVASWRKLDRPEGVAESTYRLGLIQQAMGLHPTASQSLEAALKTYSHLEDRTNESRVRLAIAETAFASGSADQALALLETVTESLTTLDNPVLVAQCALLKTRVLAQRGTAGAREAADATCRAADRTKAVIPAVQCGIARSLVLPADEAVTQALTASTRSADSGLAIHRAEADLALAEAYQRAGKTDQAAARAKLTMEEARRMGLKQIERDAAALASRSK
ncbi:MAG TPA: protein kinase [Candidatus Polarisedimenticolia bacterium]|jgi:tetratricopeptide (TPR) repeat protein